MKKRRFKLNNPIHVSIAIYQLAKLRMLEFYYDCIDKYFDRSDFEYLEMDTDSGYMAFSDAEPFKNLIKPEMREHFSQHKYDWFPRDDTPENAAFDKRTPGLFKEEWRGNAMISLSSKNYICFLPDDVVKEGKKKAGEVKISAKGVQKRRNGELLQPENFKRIIDEKIAMQANNMGFRIMKDGMYIRTYSQYKTGLNFWYDKRMVLEDGISTIHLEI
ncbi:chromodomain protein [Achlya hypogyna]|uniref:Chromodomain protein n=1 Tax=Achlya hypogyna TaxID=1202772 RepID=A0A1V9YS64_ACHHY|nr:chromodomain protein [Achlya hypogyna]